MVRAGLQKGTWQTWKMQFLIHRHSVPGQNYWPVAERCPPRLITKRSPPKPGAKTVNTSCKESLLSSCTEMVLISLLLQPWESSLAAPPAYPWGVQLDVWATEAREVPRDMGQWEKCDWGTGLLSMHWGYPSQQSWEPTTHFCLGPGLWHRPTILQPSLFTPLYIFTHFPEHKASLLPFSLVALGAMS